MPPLTVEQAESGRQWAIANPAPRAPAASPDQLAKHLRFMDAALPSRDVSTDSAKMRFAVYTSLLGSYSNDALAFMSREACQTLQWFPTVHQCLSILNGYRAPATQQATVLLECNRFLQSAMETWLDNLAAGQPIGDVPQKWIEIAITRNLLRRLKDGSIMTRAEYAEMLAKERALETPSDSDNINPLSEEAK
jgi:hypothetical protein